MVDNEMLLAMSDMMDKKFNPVIEWMDKIDVRIARLEIAIASLELRIANLEIRITNLESRMADLESRVASLEIRVASLENRMTDLEIRVANLESGIKDLKEDVEHIKGDMKHIKIVQLENNILPRLNTIEACYTGTMSEVSKRIGQMDNMEENVSALKRVVENHSERLKKIG